MRPYSLSIALAHSCYRTALHLAAIGEVACTDFGHKGFLDEDGELALGILEE